MEEPTPDRPRPRSPFAFLRPAAGLAVAYALATLIWVAAGDVLPGGRWLAVHLFTLGVLSNLITALTHHFAETVLHAPSDGRQGWRILLLNVGTAGVVVGLPTEQPMLLAAGAVLSTAAVAWLYVALRRMRRKALTARFTFVVRAYERAAGAFTHGALLGALLGIGVLGGAWHGAVRLAHLHINILGWGGIVLLATVVFFGPTVMRTKIVEGADATAARWIGIGATGLTVGALLLLATGAGAPVATAARVAAGVALAVYALAVTKVGLPVLQAGRRARPSPQGRFLLAAVGWFVVAAWADAAAVATGTMALLDPIGLLLLAAVLGQAIVGSVAYLTPMIWGGGPKGRTEVRNRLERLPLARPLAYNLGLVAVLGAALSGPAAGVGGAVAIRSGWSLIVAAVLVQLALSVSGILRARAVAETA